MKRYFPRNTRRCIQRVAAMLVVAAAAGCQSPRAARIAEHAALFASLDPATQQIIREGLFDFGFSPDLVYLSLGKPNRVSSSDSDQGPVETWVYRNFVYGNVAAVRLGANNPGTKPYGPILASSAPGGPSLSSTKAGPMAPTVSDGSDAPVGTLFIEFVNRRVARIRIEP